MGHLISVQNTLFFFTWFGQWQLQEILETSYRYCPFTAARKKKGNRIARVPF